MTVQSAAPATRLPSDQDASGRSFSAAELELVAAVLASGTLTSTKGCQTVALQRALEELLGSAHVIACASGTGAIHAAVSAVDPEPGDEIITSPITDMGAITPILYQGAIPVFADVDPITGNVTAASVREQLSDRTRAVIVTHLFGNPAEIDAIVAVCRPRGVLVIEDAAQAILARAQGRLAGTIGDIGCFSFQQGKHITAGEGGAVVTNDASLARRIRLFVNKAWPYGESGPDHEFIALNGRISELQSAVLLGQLSRLPAMAEHRHAMACRLSSRVAELPALSAPRVLPGDHHAYWRYCLRVDSSLVKGGPDAVAQALARLDIPAAPRYIQKPAFRCKVIAEQRTFGNSRWPFTLARPEATDYSEQRFPGTFAMLSEALVLPWNERLTEAHIDAISVGLQAAIEGESR